MVFSCSLHYFVILLLCCSLLSLLLLLDFSDIFCVDVSITHTQAFVFFKLFFLILCYISYGYYVQFLWSILPRKIYMGWLLSTAVLMILYQWYGMRNTRNRFSTRYLYIYKCGDPFICSYKISNINYSWECDTRHYRIGYEYTEAGLRSISLLIIFI